MKTKLSKIMTVALIGLSGIAVKSQTITAPIGQSLTVTNSIDITVATGSVNVPSDGSYNIGTKSILSNKGTANVFLGESAGPVNTGYNNLFMGAKSGFVNTTGYNNSFIGSDASQHCRRAALMEAPGTSRWVRKLEWDRFRLYSGWREGDRSNSSTMAISNPRRKVPWNSRHSRLRRWALPENFRSSNARSVNPLTATGAFKREVRASRWRLMMEQLVPVIVCSSVELSIGRTNE